MNTDDQVISYAENAKQARLKLKDMLESGSGGIIIINPGIADGFREKGCKAVIFDFDGVLLKEIGIAERGYAWVIRAVRDGITDPENIEDQPGDIETARAFRPTIKGKSITEKISIFRSTFAKTKTPVNVSDEEIVNGWYDFFRNFVQSRYGENKKEYMLPGALELLNDAHKRARVFGLTANEQTYATWLMEFVNLREYFDEIIGFPKYSFHGTSKASLLNDLLFRWEIEPHEACSIGDGAPDIKAGKRVGTLTVGIANNEVPINEIDSRDEKARILEKALKNGEKLIDAGCDILSTSTMAASSIATYFGAPKQGS